MISKFITLTDYCVLEYIMSQVGETNPELLNTEFYLINNSYIESYQIYNADQYSITNNTRGLSVIPTGGSNLVRNDLTDIPIYSQYDQNITETLIDGEYSSMLVMDTLRFHFASGFNFSEIPNIILGARQKLNNLSQIQLANVLINAQTSQSLLIFNPRPLLLANTMYDKYIDIKIPNCANLDDAYTQFLINSFEGQITNNIGFIAGSPVTVSLSEAVAYEIFAENGEIYEGYRVTEYYEGSVPQTNEFDSLGAEIREATDGDYIEFFATWNGAFPEDLISTLNTSGPNNDWIIVHQLKIYELVGSTQVPSGTIVIYQEDQFDEPLVYRPILKNAGSSIAMSIDYLIRLLNRKTGDQIIRSGSLSIFNPNKYGKSLAKIQLNESVSPVKVYNKIIQKNIESSQLFIERDYSIPLNETTNPVYITKEVKVSTPILYKQANIKISHRNALLSNTSKSSNLVYGQGDLVIPIDPTDNFIKFIIYQEDTSFDSKRSQSSLNYIPLDLNILGTFKLVFGENSEYSYTAVLDPAFANPSVGELVFRIPKDQAKKVLKLSDNLMYITVESSDLTETLLYTGSWVASKKYSEVLINQENKKNSIINEADYTILNLQKAISELQSENELLKSTTSTKSIKPESINSINAVSKIKKVSD